METKSPSGHMPCAPVSEGTTWRCCTMSKTKSICPNCNYSISSQPLDKASMTTCPECGYRFDPNDPRSFRKSVSTWQAVLYIMCTILILFAIAIPLYLVWLVVGMFEFLSKPF